MPDKGVNPDGRNHYFFTRETGDKIFWC